MNFYWFDHKGRNDSPHLDGFDKVIELFSAEKVGDPDEFRRLPPPRLGFIHAGDGFGESSTDWKNVASEGAWIVFLSSVAGAGELTSVVHALRNPCIDVAKYLTREIANRFRESCKKGKPDFALFYSHPTNYLVALYLLELVKPTTDAMRRMKEQIRPTADLEYSGFKGPSSHLPLDSHELLNALKEVLTRR